MYVSWSRKSPTSFSATDIHLTAKQYLPVWQSNFSLYEFPELKNDWLSECFVCHDGPCSDMLLLCLWVLLIILIAFIVVVFAVVSVVDNDNEQDEERTFNIQHNTTQDKRYKITKQQTMTITHAHFVCMCASLILATSGLNS